MDKKRVKMVNEHTDFYDAITAINISNGIVKLVLGNQDIEEVMTAEGKAVPPTPSKTIALPINTFLYALAVFSKEPKNQDMLTKMQEEIEAQARKKETSDGS